MVVDPGETCGIAIGTIPTDWRAVNLHAPKGGVPCGEVYRSLLASHQHIDALVIEEFRLYPGKAGAQIMSTFPTVEVIGVLKYLAASLEIPYYMQKAADMTKGRAVAFQRGVMMQDRRKNGKTIVDFAEPKGPWHPRDAKAHWYYFAEYNQLSPLYNSRQP